MSTFKELGLGEALLKAIDAMGFVEPSEVQQKAIPILLNRNRKNCSIRFSINRKN